MEELTRKEAATDRPEMSRLHKEENRSVNGYIAIKGTRNGLLLTLEPGTPFSELLNALAERISESPSFFRGASLSVDTSLRSLHASERSQLENLLAHYHMSVATIDAAQAAEKRRATQAAITLPLPESSQEVVAVTRDFSAKDFVTRDLAAKEKEREKEVEQALRDGRDTEDTLFLRRTVRSGQAIHHASNVVVLGDVNPGAEIVAGGDIIVWGVLRGMVHAGYPEHDNALVCALQLTPVQLRISRLLSRPPEGFEAQPRAEIASIKQGQIVVEPWNSGRTPRR